MTSPTELRPDFLSCKSAKKSNELARPLPGPICDARALQASKSNFLAIRTLAALIASVGRPRGHVAHCATMLLSKEGS